MNGFSWGDFMGYWGDFTLLIGVYKPTYNWLGPPLACANMRSTPVKCWFSSVAKRSFWRNVRRELRDLKMEQMMMIVWRNGYLMWKKAGKFTVYTKIHLSLAFQQQKNITKKGSTTKKTRETSEAAKSSAYFRFAAWFVVFCPGWLSSKRVHFCVCCKTSWVEISKGSMIQTERHRIELNSNSTLFLSFIPISTLLRILRILRFKKNIFLKKKLEQRKST